MNTEELLQKYSPLLKKHWLPIALAILGLIFFVYGLIGFSGSSGNSDDVVFESANEDLPEKSSAKITVDVEGEVIKPGVYTLASNSRIQEALVTAGGLSDKADREWTARNLNLALKLKDGAKIYIPGQDEAGVKSVIRSSGSGQAGDNIGALQQININSATAVELDSLPNVGPSTAQKIINGRPYNSIEELVEKKVISNSVFEKIKDRITVY